MSDIEIVQAEYLSKAYWKDRCYVKTKEDKLDIDKFCDILVIFFDSDVKRSYIYTRASNITGKNSQFNLTFNFGDEKEFDHIISKDEALDLILFQRI